ncbi:MAG: hypothetical protein H6632_15545 [Anaerolineales bacterium]|nr:hypothetical protein [Anaerolineales bacterium]
MHHQIPNPTDYEIDPERGFLLGHPPLKQLPAEFEKWEQVAAQVPILLMTGRLRSTLQRLPRPDLNRLETIDHWRRAMLLLSVFGQSYVWGENPPATVIPRSIAGPWWQVAEKLGRPPIASHASLGLYNWRLIDEDRPFDLDNVDTLQPFLGGLDERWFYVTTAAIEARGGPAVAAIVEAQTAVSSGRVEALMAGLEKLKIALGHMQAVLLRIPEKCSPYIFFHRIRPFIAGWDEAGLIYEGVSQTPQHFVGGSAAQSSLLPALDAGLGIEHLSPHTGSFMQEMRRYMPPSHRNFVQAVENGPSVRPFVLAQALTYPALADLYNDCLAAVDQFRKKHLEIAVRYIMNEAPDDERAAYGTGGSSFVPFLSTARQETKERKINRQ